MVEAAIVNAPIPHIPIPVAPGLPVGDIEHVKSARDPGAAGGNEIFHLPTVRIVGGQKHRNAVPVPAAQARVISRVSEQVKPDVVRVTPPKVTPQEVENGANCCIAM